MESTIIGVYEERMDARSTKHDLLASGFPRTKVQLTPDDEFSEAADAAARAKAATVDSSIGNVFRSLFNVGNKTTYSNVYADEVRHGNSVVTVDVENDEQRMRAMDIIAQHKPIEIEERSANWMRQGWRGHDPQADASGGKAIPQTNPGNKNPGNKQK